MGFCCVRTSLVRRARPVRTLELGEHNVRQVLPPPSSHGAVLSRRAEDLLGPRAEALPGKAWIIGAQKGRL